MRLYYQAISFSDWTETDSSGSFARSAPSRGVWGHAPQENFGFLTFGDRFWCNLEVIAIAIPSGSISIGRLKRSNREHFRENDGAGSAIATVRIRVLSN